ncbi:MAG: 2-succinyl-5-enolpyruvyl-6-hydroxy-3-cyclohexene-1-carboxylic-acid synthase, partial [Solirubrobacterales bacterium]|nr:2-succinyl-5-enolpyruvyl-6-hydroxy-3-cyclohexene-1-carboxylic-acid synthase [Solirubrobacterales bacterium]
LSGARRGAAAIAHYDALLRDRGFADELTPDLVLRVGDLPVSKPLRSWLESLAGIRQVALDPEGAWQDPAAVLSESFALEPAAALDALLEDSPNLAPQEWLERWRRADRLAAEAIHAVLGESPISEPAVAAELGVLLAEQNTLFVASSMPVRDIETFWPVREDPPRVLCNRGANGIDGTVSAAFGAAAAHDGAQVMLLIGDVALAHDIGGLLAASRLQLRLTIVLLNNDGGGIFDFLPVAGARMALASDPALPEHDIYTRHVATPTGLDFSRAAALYGLDHERVANLPGFRAALERALAAEGSSIVEVPCERAANVALHRRMWQSVAESLSR